MAADLVSYRDLLARPTSKPDAHIPYGSGPQQFVELWLPKTSSAGSRRLLAVGTAGP
jgi:hypothetical protein